MPSPLPTSRLVNVQVILTPAAAQAQNLSDQLILGSSTVIDVVERMRVYSSLTAVAADFASNTPEYLAAVLWFEQAPQPSELLIGRWAQSATNGLLRGATLSSAQQALNQWTTITNGGFHITIDGGASTNITGLNFSTATTLNQVAATIGAALTGATCTWDSVNGRFTIQSSTTGTGSTISFLTAPAAGTDISAQLGMRSTSSGAYVANGIAAETALACVQLFDAQFPGRWYAVNLLGGVDADYTAIGGYIEGANVKHIQANTTQEAGAISATSTTDLAYLMSQLKYKRSCVQYSSQNAYAASSLLGRALTVDYNANQSVITLMYKQEPGIVAETLTETQLDALEAKNANAFVNYNNDTAIIEPGVMASGDYIDIITGTDWLAVAVQSAVYNLLYTSPTKIPQTDAGNNQIVNTITKVLSRAVTNGLLAPGVWDAAGFGALNEGDFLSKGFYVYAPPIASQSAADRAARKSVTIQVAAKLAGAVQTVNVIINVNR